MKILGISGSLRSASYNTGLLKAAASCLPEEAELHIQFCGDIPLYNADLDGQTKPDPVARLIEAIDRSDAFLFATPEYNHSIPGVLKNALDWASRPAFQSPMAHKPAGIISASKSFVGGARAQMHLRQVLDSMLTPVFPSPDFLVGLAPDKFGHNGSLSDPETRARLQKYLLEFVAWIGNRNHSWI